MTTCDEGPLAGLKDFQRRTVEYVFRRMYQDQNPARRFLVADEVGLGKTMVARGLISRIIEHLTAAANGVKRIDIVYVCSNADIARQNVERLNSSGRPAFTEATRLTLLPLKVKELDPRLNFISVTPGTTFSLGQKTGRKDERLLLYHMLLPMGGLSGKGLSRLLQASAGKSWSQGIQQRPEFSEGIARAFRKALEADAACYSELRELCALRHDGRRSVDDEQRLRERTLIGKLRQHLAKCCLDALEPDLVILDEFQRFKDLLDAPEGNPTAELAQALFHHSHSTELRVLLLSATPYKMYTRDSDEENHYADFLQTVGFLLDDKEELARLEAELADFRHGLQALEETDRDILLEAKGKVERRLRRIMCRTERVGATVKRDAMVHAQRPALPLAAEDLADLRMVDAIGRMVGDRDVLEYWKSSPYLLNFMKEYALKEKLRDRLKKGDVSTDGVFDILRRHSAGLLQKDRLAAYAPLEPANARLRLLVRETLDSGLWRLLWLPPSLPYWRPEGPYADIDGATKTLVFSSWQVVPDAIAAVLSYAVEQQAVTGCHRKVDYESYSNKFKPLLRLTGDPGKKRMVSLNHLSHMMLALFFPSAALAELIDPLEPACATGDRLAWADVHAEAVRRIRARLQPFLPRNAASAKVDVDWYWRALILLERKAAPGSRDWCAHQWTASPGKRDDGTTKESARFERFRQSWLRSWDDEDWCIGRPPDDLCDVLADIALAGPGVCALRALRRACPNLAADDAVLRTAAAKVAEGLRSLFNAPESRAILEGLGTTGSYWRRVLAYCAAGNLQAVLDEQAHVLRETLGLCDTSSADIATKIAEEIHAALTIKTITLRPDEIHVEKGKPKIGDIPIRCHYALRFGDQRDEEGNVSRKEAVRTAFNSPFRPFVLASTSVGQEGLDFHIWCHSLTHWNLPSNPVDLEQREGRVQRYKGHAVRKNVAAAFGLKALAGRWRPGDDPWRILFELAHAAREADSNDLVPYWIFETDGGAAIERRILAEPYSRDEGRYHRLQRSLALYRMVFGQPRQEDLLECLAGRLGSNGTEDMAACLRIRLEPPGGDSI